MKNDTLTLIADRLKKLSPDKLSSALDFISYLSEKQFSYEAFQTMLASEKVLSRDWDKTEEDLAWKDL